MESGGSSADDEPTFHSQHCSAPAYAFLAEVDADYVADSFNLTGLRQQVPHYREALATDLPDFYRPDHGRLWMLLRDMRAAGDVVDLVTVTEAVLRGGHADQYGGLTYVLSLTERVSSTVNLSHYARIVADGHQRRRLEREAAAVAHAAREGVQLVSLRAALALLSEAPGGEGADDWVT